MLLTATFLVNPWTVEFCLRTFSMKKLSLLPGTTMYKVKNMIHKYLNTSLNHPMIYLYQCKICMIVKNLFWLKMNLLHLPFHF